jgi:hypothetical protein
LVTIYAHSIGGDVAPHEQTNDDRVLAYVISKNIHRRHLTAEQKLNLLVELVKASPEKSDRALAKEAGTTHPTIAKARRQAEATGKALPVEKRTGADGKARKQPAKKAKGWGRIVLAEGENESWVAEPDEIKSNFLDTIDRHAAVVRAYKKVFAVAALNQVQKDEISAAIRKLITKWTSLDRTLAAPVENGPPPDVGAENMKAKMAALDDDLDIPESLRRQG